MIILLLKFVRNILVISSDHLIKLNVKDVLSIQLYLINVDAKLFLIVLNNVNKGTKDFILEIVNMQKKNSLIKKSR